jgi:hypothetical protein
MQDNIDNILAEIYQTDPSLKAHDAVLRKLVSELLIARPEAKIDQAFKSELRLRLQEAMDNSTQKSPVKSFWSMFNRTWQISLGSALVVILIVLAVSVNQRSKNSQNNLADSGNQNSQNTIALNSDISKVGNRAFGSLSGATGAAGYGMGGGGGLGSGSAPAVPAPTSGVTDSRVGIAPEANQSMTAPASEPNSKMIAPYPTISYVYKYVGEKIDLKDKTVSVLKEKNGSISSAPLLAALNKMNLGAINLGSFSDKTVDSIQISEDRDLGYTINVDMVRGAISMYQNYRRWPQMYYGGCAADACSSAPAPLQIGQVPADSEVIAIADTFLKEHGVPTEAFGKPVINKDWMMEYNRSADKSFAYVPDQVSIVYPMNLDGKQVYDQSGNLTGLYIGVDVRNKKVSSMYELNLASFEASGYEAETDWAKIIKIATNGGWSPWGPIMYAGEPDGGSGIKADELKLQTPHFALVKSTTYKLNENQTLYLPALIFPIEYPANRPAYSYMKSVVVPLVKEVLDQPTSGVTDPPVHIMK